MKWLLLTAVVLTAWLGLPFHRYDTAKLRPIRCLQARREGTGIHIVSEAGEGYGGSWQEAVEDLLAGASGEVFFDTAEQVVFSDEALAQEAVDSGILRPAAEVFYSTGLYPPEDLHQ